MCNIIKGETEAEWLINRHPPGLRVLLAVFVEGLKLQGGEHVEVDPERLERGAGPTQGLLVLLKQLLRTSSSSGSGAVSAAGWITATVQTVVSFSL